HKTVWSKSFEQEIITRKTVLSLLLFTLAVAVKQFLNGFLKISKMVTNKLFYCSRLKLLLAAIR
ncbi:MAG: hypothetical protein ACI9NN_001120, partial [Bacteroidia bacterium]